MTKLLSVLALLFMSCASANAVSSGPHAPYPEEWWAPVAKDGAPSWEILPQEAGVGEVILSKRTELGILSNFAATPFVYDGVSYASVEGFWQMMKYPEGRGDERLKDKRIKWPHTRAEVAAMSAFDAKAAGSAANALMKKLGIDWVTYAGKKMVYRENSKGEFYRLIVDSMRAKMEQNPQVQAILKKTGTLILKADHHQDATVAPAWRYHEIWMEFRSGL